MLSVSVVIPNYNHGSYLRQRIDSVLNQTFQDFEVIILDDCSTDNSRDVIESYRSHPKVARIIYNDQNSGSPFIQWQKGMLLARGKWVWIAESDDYTSETFLEELIDLAETKENIGIAFCGSYWVDANGETGEDLSVYKESFFRKGTDEIKVSLSKFCTIQNVSSCIINRNASIGKLHNLGNLKACGDWIFYVRLLHNTNLVFLDKKLNFFRWYHNNTSSAASKNGLWFSEGVKVLYNMDFRKLSYEVGEFFTLIKYWYGKSRSNSMQSDYRSCKIFFFVSAKYFFSKVSI